MVSINFGISQWRQCRRAVSGDVGCTGDAEAMAVRYGCDGRCGRILNKARAGPNRGLYRRQTSALSPEPPHKESDWQYRPYNTSAGCGAGRKAT